MSSATHDEAQGVTPAEAVNSGGIKVPLGWVLLAVATAALVALLIVALVIGMRVSNRVDDIEERIPILASDDLQVVNALLELRVLTYWLAYPTTKPVVLEPPSGIGNSQGVLRVADDGLSGIVMVAAMQELPLDSVYQVWLIGDGPPVRAAQLRVDPSGWGATTIYLEDPIGSFDALEITVERVDGLGPVPGQKVLEAQIGSQENSEEDSG